MAKPVFLHRLGATCGGGLLVCALLWGCSAKITRDPGLTLAEKVKSSQNAYLRYSQAEEDARREGNLEAQERYHQAKENALSDYKRYDQELTRYKAGHSGKLPAGATP